MKIKFFLVATFFAGLFVPTALCEGSSNIPLQNCKHIFYGTIGKKFEVRMEFEIYGNSLRGSYYYFKHKEYIWINGLVDEKGHFTIEEHEIPSNIPTGTFEGDFVSASKMEGKWYDAKREKSYNFILEKKRFVEQSGIVFGNKRYYVIRQPKDAENDSILLKIDGEGEISIENFYQNIDVSTIEVAWLSGRPNLYYIKGSTIPQGNGGYQSHFYLLCPEKNIKNILMKRSVGQGHTSVCDGGYGKYDLNYKGNIVTVTEYYHTMACSKTEQEPEPTCWESKFHLNFKITKEAAILVEATKFERQSNKCEELGSQKWLQQKIPLKQAEKEFPPIEENID